MSFRVNHCCYFIIRMGTSKNDCSPFLGDLSLYSLLSWLSDTTHPPSLAGVNSLTLFTFFRPLLLLFHRVLSFTELYMCYTLYLCNRYPLALHALQVQNCFENNFPFLFRIRFRY